MNEIVIDGKNAVLGRLASFAAKSAIKGKNVVIVNCNEVIIAGSRRTTIKEYKAKRALGSANLRGPYFPKSPERVVKRTIRGMIPYRTGRGKLLLKNVMCYNSVPESYVDSDKLLAGKPKKTRTIKLAELHKEI